MNVWLARAALRTRGLSAGAFRVLLAHADACRPSGRTCLAGLEELAEACELSPKHVMRLRAQLVEAGHLRRLAAAHPDSGRYTRCCPLSRSQYPLATHAVASRVGSPRRVAWLRGTGRTAATPLINPRG